MSTLVETKKQTCMCMLEHTSAKTHARTLPLDYEILILATLFCDKCPFGGTVLFFLYSACFCLYYLYAILPSISHLYVVLCWQLHDHHISNEILEKVEQSLSVSRPLYVGKMEQIISNSGSCRTNLTHTKSANNEKENKHSSKFKPAEI